MDLVYDYVNQKVNLISGQAVQRYVVKLTAKSVKLVQLIQRSLVREVASLSPVSTKLMLLGKLSVLEIPFDKELTANCPIETHMKL